MTHPNFTDLGALDTRPLVVFSDDWAQHPSSTQHIITQMLPHRQVLWVNTIATRRPTLCLSDLKKVTRKLSHWVAPAKPQSSDINNNPIVLNPIMWPSYRGVVQRTFNSNLIARCVNKAIKQHFAQKPIVLTTLPITADLIGKIDAEAWVYHIVDDFAAWPGLDRKPLQDMHEKQLRIADKVAVVSQYLATQCENLGRGVTTLISHGVNSDHWQSNALTLSDHPVINSLQEMHCPIALFWGLIDERLDFQALRELSAYWPGEIALVGPHAPGIDDQLKIKALRALGAVDYKLLPEVAHLADVLIMPYRHAPVTAAMQPLKLMEYLSTDKPVVCTNIPATQDYTTCCDVVTPENFAEQTITRYNEGITESQLSSRLQIMKAQTWQGKANQLNDLINTHIQTGQRGKAA